MTAQNGHINQGGAFQKRKAFVRNALPANTFGLQATAAGIAVFGSDADPYSGAQWAALSAAVGQTVYYQRLQHPLVSGLGQAYNGTYHDMTGVNYSAVYLGKAVVNVAFEDGSSCLFYDGSPVLQYYNGKILWGSASSALLNKQITTGISLECARHGWFTDEITAITNPQLIVFQALANTIVRTEAAGVTFSVTYDSLPNTGGGPAWLQFYSLGAVAAYAGLAVHTDPAGTPTGITIAGGAGSTYLVYGPVYLPSVGYNSAVLRQKLFPAVVVWGINDATTAGNIVTQINAGTALHGFTASNVGAIITITSLIPASTGVTDLYFNPGVIQVVATGDATANGLYGWTAQGQKSLPAYGQKSEVSADLFTTGNQYSWKITINASNGDFTIGRGNLANATTNECYVFNTQLLLTAGSQFNFSSPGDPTGWEQQNSNAGYLPFTSQYGAQDTVQGFSAYQGRLAVFGRRSVQIWNWSADPNSQGLAQTLANTGTVAPNSIRSLGDLDVLYLGDTGVRSLRAKDASLNAYVNDIGSPIDSLVTPSVTAHAVIEPTTGAYWLYSNGTIYVLTYYPTNKIIAWSTYLPTYDSGGQQTFTPTKFTVYNGQVFARDTGAIYAYGGATGAVYDNCVATMTTPWLTAREPGVPKQLTSMEVVRSGAWAASVGVDFVNNTFKEVSTDSSSSFDLGRLEIAMQGSHFAFSLSTTGATAATVESLLLRYDIIGSP